MNTGRLSVSFADFDHIYENKGRFIKVAGSQTSVGLSFRLTKIVDWDTPYIYKKKDDKYIKNMKKDVVHVIFSGIDQVEWKSNMESCLTKGAIGILPDENDELDESVLACVTTDKKFF